MLVRKVSIKKFLKRFTVLVRLYALLKLNASKNKWFWICLIYSTIQNEFLLRYSCHIIWLWTCSRRGFIFLSFNHRYSLTPLKFNNINFWRYNYILLKTLDIIFRFDNFIVFPHFYKLIYLHLSPSKVVFVVSSNFVWKIINLSYSVSLRWRFSCFTV